MSVRWVLWWPLKSEQTNEFNSLDPTSDLRILVPIPVTVLWALTLGSGSYGLPIASVYVDATALSWVPMAQSKSAISGHSCLQRQRLPPRLIIALQRASILIEL